MVSVAGVLGIDFGTQSTRLAHSSGDVPAIVVDDNGSPEISSAVQLDDHALPVRSIKRLLGLGAEDSLVRRIAATEGHRLEEDNGELVLRIGEHAIAPANLAGKLLKQCAELATRKTGSRAQSSALVAPAWFDEKQKIALCAAAFAAELELDALISSPAAIALYLAREKKRSLVIVEVGAGGVSATLVQCRGDSIEVVTSASDRMIGSEDIDAAVMDRAMRELAPLHGTRGDRQKQARLRSACESAKKEYCRGKLKRPRAGKRARLDGILDLLLARVEHVCRCVFEETSVFKDPIHAIHLAGEAAKVDAVRSTVERVFLRSVAEDVPSDAAAIGAAMFALARRDKKNLIVNDGPLATPVSLASADLPSLSGDLFAASTGDLPPPAEPAPQAPQAKPIAMAEIIQSGKLWVPSKAAEMLALPLDGALTDRDISPIALPVLLARVLSRKQNTGTMTIESGTKRVEIAVHEGVATLNKAKVGALGLAFKWTQGVYRFDAAIPRRDPQNQHGFWGLTARGLRATLRAESEEEIAAALGYRMKLAPSFLAGRTGHLSRLGLPIQETSFAKAACSGSMSAHESLSRGGLPKQSALAVFVLLTAFGLIEWR